MKAVAAAIGVFLISIGLMLTAVGFVDLPHNGSLRVWFISWIPIALGIAAFFVKPRVSRPQGFDVVENDHER